VDVHDVVRAYNILLKEGKRGEVYNICSGTGRAIRDIVTELSTLFEIPVEIKQEQSEIRPIDNPRIIGSNEKMRQDFNWRPMISFDQTLRSMYDWWDLQIITSG
jgi:GDP-4-dehydro-6-deoxy-D-mannose reductase